MLHRVLTMLFCLCIAPVSADTLSTPSGLITQAHVYGEPGKPLAVVFIHGKGSEPDKPDYKSLYSNLNDAGYQVIAPRMPWAGEQWTGTLSQAMEVIDAAVGLVAKSGRKVVVGGHSYGGMAAILYRPANPPPSVVGRFMLVPAGMVDLSEKMQRALAPSLARAKQMVAEGRSQETERFSVTNVGKGNRVFIDTLIATPEVMLSYHDAAVFPSTRDALGQIRQPVFWAVGENDPIPYNRKPLYDVLPVGEKSAYLELPGGHVDMLGHVAEPLVDWLGKLGSR
jgi:pimeloyl-ACP methyl ester carboxylesterase